MAKTPDSRRPDLAGAQNRGSKKGSKIGVKMTHFGVPGVVNDYYLAN